MGEEPFGSGTDLPGMQEAGFDDAVDRFIQIDVAQEPRRVFAAQFQGGAGQAGTHGALTDGNAGRHRAGERHLVGARVFDQPFANQPAPCQYVQCAGRETGFNGQFGDPQDGQRVNSLGLMMMLQPVTSAEASFQIAIMVEKFHGTMPTTTPTGWRKV